MNYRLNIDIRTAANTIKEEQLFESLDAAERYYLETRSRVAAGGKIESRSSISQFLGGSQAQFWSVCKHFEENVKREYVWWKK